MDISDTWGYAAVFRRSTGDWQGFFVPDPDDPLWKGSVERALVLAAQVTKDLLSLDRKRPIGPEGGLAGTLVALLYEQDWERVGVLAAALSKLTDRRFWIVAAESDGEGGFNTDFTSLKVTTPAEARDLINTLGTASQLDVAFAELVKVAREG